MARTTTKGKLEVICGSMFSGKTEELIRRLRRAQIAQLKTQVFKHSLDNRLTTENLHSHNGDKISAIAIDTAAGLKDLALHDVQVIGIDEVQFFSIELINVIQMLLEQGKQIYAAGLDLDFRGVPFGCMPPLLALADTVIKLKAVCITCGNDAHFTQRLVNGKPARFTDPIILIGAEECYQARCRTCYEIDIRPRGFYF
jgi:thymidine kinase